MIREPCCFLARGLQKAYKSWYFADAVYKSCNEAQRNQEKQNFFIQNPAIISATGKTMWSWKVYKFLSSLPIMTVWILQS